MCIQESWVTNSLSVQYIFVTQEQFPLLLLLLYLRGVRGIDPSVHKREADHCFQKEVPKYNVNDIVCET